VLFTYNNKNETEKDVSWCCEAFKAPFVAVMLL